MTERGGPDDAAAPAATDELGRLRAELAAATAREARYRALLDATPDALWACDPGGRIVHVEGWEKLTDQPEDVYLSGEWLNLVHPDEREAVTAAWAHGLTRPIPFDMAFRMRGRSGDYRHLVVYGIPVLGAHGEIKEWLGRSTDVTRLEQAEVERRIANSHLEERRETMKRHASELETQVARHREDAKQGVTNHARLIVERQKAQRRAREAERFFDIAGDLMLTCTAEGLITRVNPAFQATLGYRADEVVERWLADFLHPDDAAATADALERLKAGEQVDSFESRYRHRQGDYRTLSWTATFAEGTIYATARDVTEHKQVEAELARQRDFTWRIIDNAPLSMAYLDRDLVYQWVNPMHAKSLGIPIDRTIGKTFKEVYGEEGDAQIAPLMRRVFETGQPYDVVGLPFKHVVDGVVRSTHWDMTFQPICRDGEVVGLLGLAQEVSERIEKERLQADRLTVLEEAEKVKDQFLGVLSHELRTPINAIMGFGSVLEDGLAGPLNGGQRSYASRILNASETLLALVSDLLDLSRVQAGMFTIQTVPIDVSRVLERTLAVVGGMAEQKGITLTHRVPGELPLVEADEERIAQVITNLVSNAVKFTQAGGWVEVRALVEPDVVRIEVEDNGPGIDPAIMDSLFLPFTQVDMSRTRRYGGLGLGLAISKSLIESHGGRIGVGTRMGQGATFWFTLPRIEQPT